LFGLVSFIRRLAGFARIFKRGRAKNRAGMNAQAWLFWP
jgi:hypothetical protein